MRKLLQIALVAAITPWALAQSRVSVHPLSPSPVKPGPSAAVQGVRNLPPVEDFATFRKFHSHPNSIPLFPFGLFSDSLFPGNPAPQPSAPAAAPALNLMEALSALGKSRDQPPPPASQPLLIELQGDRYVRLNSGDASENPQDSREPIRVIASPGAGMERSTQNAALRNAAARELPPTLLIYRDGHREEVRDYSIISGVMYARGDYYTDGYWNKKIELTALDLAETLKSNELRGVPFILPNAPNEVVTRP